MARRDQGDRDELAERRRERDRHREPVLSAYPRRDLTKRNAFYVGLLAVDGAPGHICPICSGPVYAPADSDRERVDCPDCNARLTTRRDLDGGVSIVLLGGAP